MYVKYQETSCSVTGVSDKENLNSTNLLKQEVKYMEIVYRLGHIGG